MLGVGALWGNNTTNPQGEALKDALDKCNLTCINDGSITRTATRPGVSDSVIDLALTTLQLAQYCHFQVLVPHGNDHYPFSISVRRSRVSKQTGKTRVFHYCQNGEGPVSKLSTRNAPMTVKQWRREQTPWFDKVIEELWIRKRTACKQYQRNNKDEGLKNEAKQASSTVA